MAASLIINGKFLSVPMTGVHRVAQELANALADLTAEGAFPGAEVWLPYDGAKRAKSIRLPSRVIGPLRGIPWEQLTLPIAARGRMLLNFCNIAPMAATDAVTMIHDAQVHLTPESYGAAFGAWYRFTQPLIANRHRHLLTVSEYSKRRLVEAGLGAPDKISVIHNGIDHILAQPAEPLVLTRIGVSSRRFVVALASTQAHKNVGLLLRAFADARLAHLKLVLVGGSGPKAFQPIAPVPANVLFSGRISDGELRALYEHALCVAFPSTTEGFGLPPLEGMRLGCPAIAAPCGALPEVCADAAIYAPPTSALPWIEAILDLSESKSEWLRRSRQSEAHASRFTWRRSAERLLDVLRSIGVIVPPADSSPQQMAA
jgi:glycosyltransferase involved in cell wall biosynthesis